MKKKPVVKEIGIEPQPAPDAPSLEKPAKIAFVNTTNQPVNLQVEVSGKSCWVVIPAHGKREFDRQDDYGPDVNVKIRQNLIHIKPCR